MGVEHEREERYAGTSKAHSIGVLQLAVKAILAHSQVPLVIISIVGVGLFVVSIVALVVLTIDWATLGVPFPGFGTIVALMVMLFGILFCLMGIVSIYIGQIYEEVKGRPKFHRPSDSGSRHFSDRAQPNRDSDRAMAAPERSVEHVASETNNEAPPISMRRRASTLDQHS